MTNPTTITDEIEQALWNGFRPYFSPGWGESEACIVRQGLSAALQAALAVMPADEDVERLSYNKGHAHGYNSAYVVTKRDVEEAERERDEARAQLATARQEGRREGIEEAVKRCDQYIGAVSGACFFAGVVRAILGQPAPEWRPTHRHRKRGTEIRVIGSVQAQTEYSVYDCEPFVLYKGRDGQKWVRPESEFNDGRFEEIAVDVNPANE